MSENPPIKTEAIIPSPKKIITKIVKITKQTPSSEIPNNNLQNIPLPTKISPIPQKVPLKLIGSPLKSNLIKNTSESTPLNNNATIPNSPIKYKQPIIKKVIKIIKNPEKNPLVNNINNPPTNIIPLTNIEINTNTTSNQSIQSNNDIETNKSSERIEINLKEEIQQNKENKQEMQDNQDNLPSNESDKSSKDEIIDKQPSQSNKNNNNGLTSINENEDNNMNDDQGKEFMFFTNGEDSDNITDDFSFNDDSQNDGKGDIFSTIIPKLPIDNLTNTDSEEKIFLNRGNSAPFEDSSIRDLSQEKIFPIENKVDFIPENNNEMPTKKKMPKERVTALRGERKVGVKREVLKKEGDKMSRRNLVPKSRNFSINNYSLRNYKLESGDKKAMSSSQASGWGSIIEKEQDQDEEEEEEVEGGISFLSEEKEKFLYGRFRHLTPTPQDFIALKNVNLVACGDKHFIFTSDKKLVWSFGRGNQGQLGHGDNVSLKYPKLVEFFKGNPIVYLSAGGNMSGAIDSQNKLYVWGDKTVLNVYLNVPTLHHESLSFSMVAFGKNHGVALLTEGKVITWGESQYYCLGDSTRVGTILPISSYSKIPFKKPIVYITAGEYNGAVINAKGKILLWGQWYNKNYQSPVRLPKLQNKAQFKQIKLGRNFMTGLDVNNYIWSIGSNSNGQLGIGGIGSDTTEKSTWCQVQFGTYDIEELKKGNKKKPSSTSELNNTSSNNNTLINNTLNNTKSKKTTRMSVLQEEEFPLNEELVLNSAGSHSIVSFLNSNKTFIWGYFETETEKIGTNIFNPEEIKKFSEIQILNVFSFSSQIVLSVGIQNLPSLKFSSFDPPVVQKGTVQGLFDYLFEEPIDYKFQTQFLLTHPSYLNVQELVKLLNNKYNMVKKSGNETEIDKIMIFVNELLMIKPRVAENKDDFDKMRDFLFHISENNESMRSELLRKYLQHVYPPPFPNDNVYPGVLQELFSIPPDQIAPQICLKDQNLLSRIPLHEFLNASWTKTGNTKRSPNLLKMIDDFNRSSDWAISAIFMADEAKERSHRLNWILELCENCLSLKNFYAVNWIFSAIESVAVFQLRNNKNISLKNSSKDTLKKMTKLFESNYIVYRESVFSCFDQGIPAIPTLGVHLTDLIYLEEQVSYMDNMVNWNKRMKIAEVLSMIHFFQHQKYKQTIKFNKFYNYFFHVSGFDRNVVGECVDKPFNPSLKKEFVGELPRKTSSNLGCTLGSLSRKLETEAEYTQVENRPVVWIDWIEKLKSNFINVETPEGQVISFRDAFNRSNALHNTVKSVLKDTNGIQFIKVLFGYIFGNNLNDENIDSLIFVIKQLNADKVNEETQNKFCHSLERLKYFDSLHFSSNDIHIEEKKISEENSDQIMIDFIDKVRIFAQYLVLKPNFQDKLDFSPLNKVAENYVNTRKKFEAEFGEIEKKKEMLMKDNFTSIPFEMQQSEKLKDELRQLDNEEKQLLQRLESIKNRKNEIKEKLSVQTRNVIEFQKGHQISGLLEEITNFGNEMAKVRKNIEISNERVNHFNNIISHCLPEALKRNEKLMEIMSHTELFTKIAQYSLQILKFFQEKFQSMIDEFPKLQSRARIILRNNFERLKLKYQQMGGSIQAVLNPSFVQDNKLREEIQALKMWIEKTDLKTHNKKNEK